MKRKTAIAFLPVFLMLFTLFFVFYVRSADAEQCFNRNLLGRSDVFWGDPPPFDVFQLSPRSYPDVNAGPGDMVRLSLEGEYRGSSDCSGVSVMFEVYRDGETTPVTVVNGNLVSGSEIMYGNFGTWQWYVNWPHNLFDGRYRFRLVQVSGQPLVSVLSTNVLIISGVGAPPIQCALTANPSSAQPPLNNVDLAVSITDGWNDQAVEYRVDCTNDGIYEDGIAWTGSSWNFVDLCDYANAGQYTARAHVRHLQNFTEANCFANINVIPPPTCSASFSPSSVDLGQATRLDWNSSNDADGTLAYSCTGNIGSGNTISGGSASVSPTTSQTCTFMAVNSLGNSITCSASVTVNPPPTADIDANTSDGPLSIPYNTSFLISWNSTNIVSCTAGGSDPDWQGSVPTSGQRNSSNLTTSQTYTLTCTNASGATASDQVVVNVGLPPLPIASLTWQASTISVQSPDRFTTAVGVNPIYTWSSTNAVSAASSFTIDAPDQCPGATSTSTGPFLWVANTLNGSATGNSLACEAGRTYAITYVVTDSLGRTASHTVWHTVAVPPTPTPTPIPPLPISSISCNGVAGSCGIAYGDTAFINWSCTNSSSGSVTNNADSTVWSGTSGPQNAPNLTSSRTYTLTCTGSGGTTTNSVFVNVNPPPPTPTPEIAPQAATPFTLRILNPFSGNINTLQDLFNAATRFLRLVVGPIVVIMIILSGLFFLFGRGEPDKINTAKRILFYALIGLAIILIGQGFVALVRSILGVGT